MALKQGKEKLFEEINALYEKWESLDGRENTESAKQSVELKLIEKVYLIYYKPESSEESYAVEIVKTARACLKPYQTSEAKAKNVPFSKYICSAISNALASAEKAAFEERIGTKISDDAFKKAKKVKKLDSDYLEFDFEDEDVRNSKIADALEITTEKVVELKELLCRRAVSQFQTDENGETVDIIDKYKASSFVNPETLEEFREKCDSLFKALKDVLKNKKFSDNEAAFLKKALTVDLCRKHFPQKLADKNDGKDGQFNEERRFIDCYEDNEVSGINKEKLFKEASFFDSAILGFLFSDENYELPKMKDLAEEGYYDEADKKVKFTKSGLSKKLTRLYKEVREVFEEKSGFEKDFANKFLGIEEEETNGFVHRTVMAEQIRL